MTTTASGETASTFPFEEMTAAFEEIYGPGPVGSGGPNDDTAFEPES